MGNYYGLRLKPCLVGVVLVEGLGAGARAAAGGQGVHNGVHRLAVGGQVLPVRHQLRVLPDLVQAAKQVQKYNIYKKLLFDIRNVI